MFTKKTKFIALLLCLFFMVSLVAGCGASKPEPAASKEPEKQEPKFPTKPITLVIGMGAGGGTDVTLRALAEPMAKALGTSIVVQNMEGGGGITAMDYVTRQPADGYTLFAPVSPYAAFPALGTTKLTYRDFQMVGIAGGGVATFTVPPDSPLKDMNDLIEGLKAGNLKSGDSAIGGAWWLSTAALANKYGGKFTSVPYGSGTAGATAAAKKEVDFSASDFNEAKGLIAEKMLRPLAIMDTKGRQVGDIAVPPITDFVKDQEVIDLIPVLKSWRAIAAPKGTPQPVMDELIKAFKVAMESPEFKAFVEKSKLNVIGDTGADADKIWEDATSTISWLLVDMNQHKSDPAELNIPRP